MKTRFRIIVLAMAAGFAASFPSFSLQTETSTASPSSTGHGKTTKAGRSGQEIAAAKAKGLVWVNAATRVYHKDGPLYGTTKLGKFMTEENAKKAGYRIASENGNKKGSSSQPQ